MEKCRLFKERKSIPLMGHATRVLFVLCQVFDDKLEVALSNNHFDEKFQCEDWSIQLVYSTGNGYFVFVGFVFKSKFDSPCNAAQK